VLQREPLQHVPPLRQKEREKVYCTEDPQAALQALLGCVRCRKRLILPQIGHYD
jgi:hypothetical protein